MVTDNGEAKADPGGEVVGDRHDEHLHADDEIPALPGRSHRASLRGAGRIGNTRIGCEPSVHLRRSQHNR
jgi:hypothetical protein